MPQKKNDAEEHFVGNEPISKYFRKINQKSIDCISI
jgi:hypothetical protein